MTCIINHDTGKSEGFTRVHVISTAECTNVLLYLGCPQTVLFCTLMASTKFSDIHDFSVLILILTRMKKGRSSMKEGIIAAIGVPAPQNPVVLSYITLF